jgi:hypothetical protein
VSSEFTEGREAVGGWGSAGAWGLGALGTRHFSHAATPLPHPELPACLPACPHGPCSARDALAITMLDNKPRKRLAPEPRHPLLGEAPTLRLMRMSGMGGSISFGGEWALQGEERRDCSAVLRTLWEGVAAAAAAAGNAAAGWLLCSSSFEMARTPLVPRYIASLAAHCIASVCRLRSPSRLRVQPASRLACWACWALAAPRTLCPRSALPPAMALLESRLGQPLLQRFPPSSLPQAFASTLTPPA